MISAPVPLCLLCCRDVADRIKGLSQHIAQELRHVAAEPNTMMHPCRCATSLCCRDVADGIMGLLEHNAQELRHVAAEPNTMMHPCRCAALFCCRDVADRIMGLREHIAQEMQEELGAIHGANSDVNRRWAGKASNMLLQDITSIATILIMGASCYPDA